MNCRICQKEIDRILDLGSQPIANSLLKTQSESEMTYPLEFFWCYNCQFGQVNDLPINQIFGESYPYYSSVNKSYVRQCAEWAHEYRSQFNPKIVLEIGSNDGYMLENFKDLKHVGFEPSKGQFLKAQEKGLNVINDFFSETSPYLADLIIANNVLAHTPDLHTMVEAISKSLSSQGQTVIEFPDVELLIKRLYYDTIYHEHYSYFSINSMETIFNMHGLRLYSFERIPSHGGSIRAYFGKNDSFALSPFSKIDISNFSKQVLYSKISNLVSILDKITNGKKLALFGAAAKGNTFLNYLGIKNDIFDFCVDETPQKIGKYLPGSRIRIVGIETLYESKPDVLFILPWNFKEEIINKTSFISEWGAVHSWKYI